MTAQLTPWAAEMCDLFRSGAVSQFILHGNVFDLVGGSGDGSGGVPLMKFLDDVIFETYDVVLHYNRGRGIRATRGGEDWGDWLDTFAGPDARYIPTIRESGKALELIDRYLLRTINYQAINSKAAPGTRRHRPRVRGVRRAARRGAPDRRRVQRQRGQAPHLGQRPRHPPVQYRHRARHRGAPRPERPGGGEPPHREAEDPAARRGRDAAVLEGQSGSTLPELASPMRRADGDAGAAADRPQPRRRAHRALAGATKTSGSITARVAHPT